MDTLLSRKRIILVVEDDPLIRDFEVAALSRAGYEVLAAENGIEGGAVFARHFQEIDALITDISMPGMDGLKLASFVRKIRPDLRILFASGSLANYEATLGESMVDSTLLAKPFTSEELLHELTRMLEDRPPALPSASAPAQV